MGALQLEAEPALGHDLFGALFIPGIEGTAIGLHGGLGPGRGGFEAGGERGFLGKVPDEEAEPLRCLGCNAGAIGDRPGGERERWGETGEWGGSGRVRGWADWDGAGVCGARGESERTRRRIRAPNGCPRIRARVRGALGIYGRRFRKGLREWPFWISWEQSGIPVGMKIQAVQRRQQVRGEPEDYPRLVLERGNPWTDYPLSNTTVGYETLFDVHIDLALDRREILGSIKILQRGKPSVELPREMDALPDDCCSLGQTIDYYEALEALGEHICSDILRALRDVTADESIAEAFDREPGFHVSLTRFSEAARIYHYRPRRLHRDPPPPVPVRFSFEASLPGFSEVLEDRHKLDLDFNPEPGSVGRLSALVGKNGTGKTQLLARLAAALWGLVRHDKETLVLHGPPVGRVIAVSYSALDAFERPPFFLAGDKEQDEARPVTDNYHYCGFRDREGHLQPKLLFAGLGGDLADVTRLRRLALWKEMLAQTRLAEDDPELGAAVEANDTDGMLRAVLHLGAGQKTALTVLTRILASIRNGAVILIDEPELNLHPSLLAALLRVLHDWLALFDGHGIIATHSPIGLQEIPGRNVRVLRRVGRVPKIQPYDSESFGQSISEIVGEVFGLDEGDKNYVTVLRDLLAGGMSPKEIEEAFGRPLSLNARMAIRALAREGSKRA